MARQHGRRIRHALFVLEDEELVPVEVAEPDVECGGVETALHGVADQLVVDPRAGSIRMGQPGVEPAHRIAEEEQQAGVGRRAPEQRWDPRGREVIGRPFAGAHARRAREPAPIPRDL